MKNNLLLDKILEETAILQLPRYYVKVSRGNYEYFTRYSIAKQFAEIIGSEVKPFD